MKIEHIAVWVSDIEASKNFYMEFFGAKASTLYQNIRTGFQSYFLSFETGGRLELMNSATITNQDISYRIGYAHVAFAVGSVDKVNQLTERLRQRGYRIFSEPRTTGDGYYESCVLDPDGNKIELTV